MSGRRRPTDAACGACLAARAVATALATTLATACASAPGGTAGGTAGGAPSGQAGAPAVAAAARTPTGAAESVGARGGMPIDTSGGGIPLGFGTLRQDDLAVRVQLVGGVTVRLIPLEESFTRLLSPDSYRALRDFRASRRAALDSIARRFRYPRYSLWYVSFFGVEQGEARFSPFEVIVTNAGRDFRPLDLVPLTPGFGEQRLRQRGRQDAIYVFDGQLDPNQALTVTVETTRDESWAGAVLPRVERERALIRSRAGRAGSAP